MMRRRSQLETTDASSPEGDNRSVAKIPYLPWPHGPRFVSSAFQMSIRREGYMMRCLVTRTIIDGKTPIYMQLVIMMYHMLQSITTYCDQLIVKEYSKCRSWLK